MSIGESVLHALCVEGDTSAFFKYRLTDSLFLGDEKQAFAFVLHHVNNHAVLPHVSTLMELYPNLKPAVEPATYYLHQLDERFKHRLLNKTLQDCSHLMKDQKVDSALKMMGEVLNQVALFDVRMDMAEFGQDAYDIVMGEINSGTSGDGILFGWPYLDAMVNGLRGGDVVSYVGRPAVGKTWKLIYSAMHAWEAQEKNVMVLSMEMNILSIAQRMASLYSKVPINDVKSGFLDENPWHDEKAHLGSTLKALHGTQHKLHMIDGNLTSTPRQIFALAKQLKVDVVFIDGAYLLKNDNPKLDRFTRVAENIEEIKRLTSQLGIPTVCSYQFNRQASKKKSNDAVTLDDIGYSDAIGQISSVVLGLFEEDSVETLNARNVRVLKGRDGAVGQFQVKWDFQNMDFSEVPKVSLLQEEQMELEHI